MQLFPVIAADRRPSPSWGKREQAVQRFEHYELVTGEGGKPAELGRAAMGSFTRCSHSICITFPDSWAVERSGGTRTQGCAPRSGFSLREIARRQGRCQRRPSDPAARGERCEHMNEVTILAPNEVFEQLEASERLPQDIDPDTLRKYFTLTRPDLEQVDQCRGATNKLGFTRPALHAAVARPLLTRTREIPEPVLETLSLQLGVLPIPIDDYPQNEKTRFDQGKYHFDLERMRQTEGGPE